MAEPVHLHGYRYSVYNRTARPPITALPLRPWTAIGRSGSLVQRPMLALQGADYLTRQRRVVFNQEEAGAVDHDPSVTIRP